MAGNAFVREKRAQCRVKGKVRFAQIVMGYSNMGQAYRVAHTRADCFGQGFLGGKTLGQKHGRLAALDVVGPFVIRQQSFGKTLSIFFQ